MGFLDFCCAMDILWATVTASKIDLTRIVDCREPGAKNTNSGIAYCQAEFNYSEIRAI